MFVCVVDVDFVGNGLVIIGGRGGFGAVEPWGQIPLTCVSVVVITIGSMQFLSSFDAY